MPPSFQEIATPILIGAGLAVGLILAGMIYTGSRKKGSNETGFWKTVLNAEGKSPSFREKMSLTGITLPACVILFVLLYAWTIGFSGFSGQVEKKTVTSRGRYGSYAIQVEGKIHRVNSDVYHATEKGSRVSRPWGRPYIIVNETPYILAWPLGFFGAVGAVLMLLCAIILLLCWWPSPENHPSQ